MIIWQTKVERKGGSAQNMKAVWMICIMAIVFEWLPNEHDAFSQEKSVSSVSTDMHGSMDFKACVRLALEQSPYFTQNALEIDVRRLDESDSQWAFVPSLTLHTHRYVGLKKLDEDGEEEEIDDITHNFGFSEYDPFRIYYIMKASGMATEIAVLAHQKRIADGIYDMAGKFLDLDTLSQIADCQDKILARYREKSAFIQESQKAGTATNIEVQLVEQQLAVARAEVDYLSAKKSAIMEGLRQFLGLGSAQRLDVNFSEIRGQILGHFDPVATGLEQARLHSFELNIREFKEKLQGYRISQAYAKFVPKFSMGINKTDATQAVMPDEYYFSVRGRLNLWNGFKDVNDISRQKMILRQYKSETRLVEARLNTKWKTAKMALSEAETAMKLSRLNEEMLMLKERQSEIFYNSNREPLSTLLNQRIARLEAQKKSLQKTQEHDQNVLEIRHLSGDLFNSFINAAPWKE
jgi:outer membrane protein TolC